MNVAILHEGNARNTSDNWLLKQLIEMLVNPGENTIQFYGMGSKSNFFYPNYKDYRRLLPLIENDQIDRVLFVVDADFQENDAIYGGYENSLAALTKIVTGFGINDISQFHIFCDPGTKQGNIESLLLSTLDEEKKVCINNFLDCSDFKAKDNSKAILNKIYNTAYPEAPFDLEHTHFDELKEKLANLFN